MARGRPRIEDVLGQPQTDAVSVNAAEISIGVPEIYVPVVDMEKIDLANKLSRSEAIVASQLEIITRQDSKIADLTDSLSTAQNKIVALQKIIDSSETVRPTNQDAMVVQNPLTMVEIAEVPVAGVFPTELVWYSPDGKTQLRYPPKFDFKGNAHHNVPMEKAESLLSNQGGRKYILVFPATLRIRVSNGRHGYDQVVLNANYDIPRVF